MKDGTKELLSGIIGLTLGAIVTYSAVDKVTENASDLAMQLGEVKAKINNEISAQLQELERSSGELDGVQLEVAAQVDRSQALERTLQKLAQTVGVLDTDAGVRRLKELDAILGVNGPAIADLANIRQRLTSLEGQSVFGIGCDECKWHAIQTHGSKTCQNNQVAMGLCLTNKQLGCPDGRLTGSDSTWVAAGAVLCCPVK